MHTCKGCRPLNACGNSHNQIPETIDPHSLPFWHSNLFMHRAKQRDLNDTFSSQEAHITSSVRAIELVKLDRYVSLRNGVEARDASILKKIGHQTGGRTFAIQVLEITVAIATQNLKETVAWSARLIHSMMCLCSRPQQPAHAVRVDKKTHW